MRRLACALLLFAACDNNNAQNNTNDDLAVADLTGDGTHYMTDVNTLYTCAGGALASPQPCAFGCDVNRCKELVPSNDALAHLNGDSFSCASPSPSPVGTLGGALIDIDTDNDLVSPSPMAGLVRFDDEGAGNYVIGNTDSVVLHLRGNLTLSAGSTMKIHGARGLV